MGIRFAIIGHDDALANREFILPWIAERKNFGDYTCCAAYTDEQIAGLLIADPKIYEPEILSIGVSPEYEGKGIGTALVEFAVYTLLAEYDDNEAETDNCIIANIYHTPENMAAIKKVFEKCGFTADEKGRFKETTVKKLKDNPIVQNQDVIKKLESAEGKKGFCSLKDADRNLVRAFGNYLAKNEIFPGIDPEELDEDITMFGINDGEIMACILFGKENDGVIQNMFLYNKDTDLTSSKNVLYLLTASSCAILKKYPESVRLSFFTGNATAQRLVEKIFPDAESKEEHVRFELPLADLIGNADDRFTDDIGFTPVENASMVCKNCKYCTESVISCQKFHQKPDGVMDGGECRFFDQK